MRVSVIGAGVAGLTCALELARRGATVEVLEQSAAPAARGCSWYAGGMLAPWCEQENSGALIAQLGLESIPWWQQHFPPTRVEGTLVLAHARDGAELGQFARRTHSFEPLNAEAIAALEPELAGRFAHGLYFSAEGHLDPRAALGELAARLEQLNVPLRFATAASARRLAGRSVIDCRGLAAREELPELSLRRPVRVLHPRVPVYIVPRGAGLYMVGATMIESDEAARVSARSVLELLSAAYALHPAFGEAQILELGTGVRAAFPDNLPRLQRRGATLYVNGLYRHGFLIAPALARRAAEVVLEGRHFPEVMDEDSGQRRLA